MLEKYVAALLQQTLGKYVKHYPESVQWDVFRGYVELTDLELKPDALDMLQLPIQIHRGFIGKVQLRMTWGTSSASLFIDDVHLLVRSKYAWTEEEQSRRRDAEAAANLATAKQYHEQTLAGRKTDPGFIERLVTKVVDNLQVRVRGIHIRFVDEVSNPRSPFACGITLESLHVQSTNDKWDPSHVDASGDGPQSRFIFKCVQMNHLSIYWNPTDAWTGTSVTNIDELSVADFMKLFSSQIARCNDQISPLHHYILKPVDAELKLQLNRDPYDRTQPQHRIRLFIKQVSLGVEQVQYQHIVHLAGAISNYTLRQDIDRSADRSWFLMHEQARYMMLHLRHRYNDEFRQQLAAAQAAAGAGTNTHANGATHVVNGATHHSAATDSVPAPKRGTRWLAWAARFKAVHHLLQVSDDFVADSTLDQLRSLEPTDPVVVALPPLSPGEQALMSDIAARSSVKQILRSWGFVHLYLKALLLGGDESDTSSDSDLEGETLAVPAATQQAPANTGWFGWLWGTSQDKPATVEAKRKELYDAMGYDPAKVLRVVFPDDYVTTHVTFELGSGAFSLATADMPFMQAGFERFSVGLWSRPSTLKVDVSLGSISVFDYAPRSAACFWRIVSPKPSEHTAPVTPVVSNAAEAAELFPKLEDARRHTDAENPLLFFSYETRQPGLALIGRGRPGLKASGLSSSQLDGIAARGSAEGEHALAHANVALSLQPLEVVYNPDWVKRVSEFFTLPHDVDLQDIEAAAETQTGQIVERTQKQLRHVLSNRFAVAVNIDVHAPVLIVPENPRAANSMMLIVDFGRFTLRSTTLQVTQMHRSTSSANNAAGRAADTDSKDVHPTAWPKAFTGRPDDHVLSRYDEFQLGISSMQLLLSRADIAGWRIPSVQQQRSLHLVPAFSVKMTLWSSVVPEDDSLPRLRMIVDLPPVSLQISSAQLRAIKRLSAALAPPQAPTTPSSATLRNTVSQFGRMSAFAPLPPARRLSSHPKRRSSSMRSSDSVSSASSPHMVTPTAAGRASLSRRTSSEDTSGGENGTVGGTATVTEDDDDDDFQSFHDDNVSVASDSNDDHAVVVFSTPLRGQQASDGVFSGQSSGSRPKPALPALAVEVEAEPVKKTPRFAVSVIVPELSLLLCEQSDADLDSTLLSRRARVAGDTRDPSIRKVQDLVFLRMRDLRAVHIIAAHVNVTEVRLNQLFIEDRLQFSKTTERYHYLATSSLPTADRSEEPSAQLSDLISFQVCTYAATPLVPITTDVVVDFNTLHVNLNQRAMICVNRFFAKPPDPPAPLPSAAPLNTVLPSPNLMGMTATQLGIPLSASLMLPPPLDLAGDADPLSRSVPNVSMTRRLSVSDTGRRMHQAPVVEPNLVNVRMAVSTLVVECHFDGTPLAQFRLTDAAMTVKSMPSETVISGRLGNLRVMNMQQVSETVSPVVVLEDGTEAREVFGLKSAGASSMVSLDVRLIPGRPSTMHREPVPAGSRNHIQVKMESVKWVVHAPFLLQLMSYFLKTPFFAGQPQPAAPAVQPTLSKGPLPSISEEAPPHTGLMVSLDFELIQPLLIIPTGAGPASIIADLGRIHMHNDFEPARLGVEHEWRELVFVSFQHMHLQSGLDAIQLVEDVDMNFKVNQGAMFGEKPPVSRPIWADISISQIGVVLHEPHLALFMAAYFENLLKLTGAIPEPPIPPEAYMLPTLQPSLVLGTPASTANASPGKGRAPSASSIPSDMEPDFDAPLDESDEPPADASSGEEQPATNQSPPWNVFSIMHMELARVSLRLVSQSEGSLVQIEFRDLRLDMHTANVGPVKAHLTIQELAVDDLRSTRLEKYAQLVCPRRVVRKSRSRQGQTTAGGVAEDPARKEPFLYVSYEAGTGALPVNISKIKCQAPRFLFVPSAAQALQQFVFDSLRFMALPGPPQTPQQQQQQQQQPAPVAPVVDYESPLSATADRVWLDASWTIVQPEVWFVEAVPAAADQDRALVLSAHFEGSVSITTGAGGSPNAPLATSLSFQMQDCQAYMCRPVAISRSRSMSRSAGRPPALPPRPSGPATIVNSLDAIDAVYVVQPCRCSFSFSEVSANAGPSVLNNIVQVEGDAVQLVRDVQEHNARTLAAHRIKSLYFVNAEVGPVVVALSFQETQIIMSIASHLSQLSSQIPGDDSHASDAKEPEHPVSSAAATAAPAAAAAACGFARVSFAGAKLVVISHWQGSSQYLPVLELWCQPQLQAVAAPVGVTVDLSLNVWMNYRNHKLTAWEPLVEPWRCMIVGTINRSVQEPMAARHGAHHSHASMMELAPQRVDWQNLNKHFKQQERTTKYNIQVHSSTRLDINVTESASETLSGFLRAWYTHLGGTARVGGTREEFSMFRIRNDTGIPISFSQGNDGPVELVPGDDVPLRGAISADIPAVEGGRASADGADNTRASQMQPLQVSFHSTDGSRWRPLTGLAVDRMGIVMYKLHDASRDTLAGLGSPQRSDMHRTDDTPVVVCEAAVTLGTRVLRLRSPVLFKNRLATDLGIELMAEPGAPVVWQTRIVPAAVVPLPINLVHYKGIVRFSVWCDPSLPPLQLSLPAARLFTGKPIGPVLEPGVSSSVLRFPKTETQEEVFVTMCTLEDGAGVHAASSMNAEAERESGEIETGGSLHRTHHISDPKHHLRLLYFTAPFAVHNHLPETVTVRLLRIAEREIHGSSTYWLERLRTAKTQNIQKSQVGQWTEGSWRHRAVLQLRLGGYENWSSGIMTGTRHKRAAGSAADLTKLVDPTRRLLNSVGVDTEIAELSLRHRKLDPLTAWVRLTDATRHQLLIGVNIRRTVTGSIRLALFVPYIIHNGSGLPMLFRHDPEQRRGRLGGFLSDDQDLVAGQRTLDQLKHERREVGLLEVVAGSNEPIVVQEAPMLMDYTDVNAKRGHLQLRTPDTNWSSSIELNAVGVTSVTQRAKRRIALGVSVAPSASGLSNQVYIAPRYYLVNASNRGMWVLQSGTPDSMAVYLNVNVRIPFHWPDAGKPERIRIRPDEFGWKWSGEVLPAEIGTTTLRLTNTVSHAACLARLDVRQENASILLVLFNEGEALPPYRVKNSTLLPLRISQQGVDDSEVLLPYLSCEYTWTEPLGSKLLKVSIDASASGAQKPISLGSFSMNELRRFPPVRVGRLGDLPARVLQFEVLAEGPTRMLHITQVLDQGVLAAVRSPLLSEPYHLHNGRRTRSARSEPSPPEPSPQISACVQLSLAGIGISVVDDIRRELMYCSVSDIGLRCTNDAHQTVVELSMISFQIDNQLLTTPFPVLLEHRSPSPKDPAVRVRLQKINSFPGIIFLRSFQVELGSFDLCVDGALLTALMDLRTRIAKQFAFQGAPARPTAASDTRNSTLLESVSQFAPAFTAAQIMGADPDAQLSLSTPNMPSASSAAQNAASAARTASNMELGAALYLEEMIISATIFRLSIRMSSIAGSDTTVLGILAPLASVDQAEFLLRELSMSHVLAYPGAVVERLASFYSQQLAKQAFKLVLYADVLGNPSSLLRAVSSGFSDLFSQPQFGLVHLRPMEVSAGVVKGVGSLIRNILLALSMSATRILRTSLKVLSYDPYTHYAPQNLVHGVLMGIAGVVVTPVNAWSKHGASALPLGALVGLAGLGLKPLAGLVHLDDRSGDLWRSRRKRVRPPRFFASGWSPLEVYSSRSSVGEELLARAARGHHQWEGLVFHSMLPSMSRAIVVTKLSVICVFTGRRFYELDWSLSNFDIVHVQQRAATVVLITVPPMNNPHWHNHRQRHQHADHIAALHAHDNHDSQGARGTRLSLDPVGVATPVSMRLVERELRCEDDEHARWLTQRLKSLLQDPLSPSVPHIVLPYR